MAAANVKFMIDIMVITVSLAVAPSSVLSDTSRPIWFGTTLDAQTVTAASKELAKSLENPSSSQWQSPGDQKRSYRFPEANAQLSYRVCVPSSWDGKSKLPLVMFLHGAGNNESSYLDQNNKQMVKLADQHGYLLVSPSGCQGAYGNFLRLSSPFGDSANAAKLMDQVTPESELSNELSEKDVINVIELILNEYPIDSSSMFLTGHSMGSGGTWYIGGKYAAYWKALAPMSGPFVQQSGYPWESLRQMTVFITEGTQAPSLSASRILQDWMKIKNFNIKYKEVNADHPGMVPLVLPDVFSFFDSCRNNSVAISAKQNSIFRKHNNKFAAKYLSSKSLKIKIPSVNNSSNATVTILDIAGRKHYSGAFTAAGSELTINNILLPAGVYQVLIRTASQNGCAELIVTH